jgi:hypothetical protein
MAVLDYDPASLCGPVDWRVVRILEKRYGKKLDSSYLGHVQRHHGSVPIHQFLTDANGTDRRVGRFLPLFDNHSELELPFRPSCEFSPRDLRVDWGVLTLVEEEGPTAFCLFGCERLLPFAALYQGSCPPEPASVADGEVDLLCFLYEAEAIRPSVVVWLASEAQAEYDRWADALRSGHWEEEIRYAAFTIPVAAHFDSFLERLRREPTLDEFDATARG